MEQSSSPQYRSLVKNKRLAKQISVAVRHLRTEHGLSQEALSEACDRHPTYISHIETGKKAISVETAALIANVFQLTLTEFFAIVERVEIEDN